MGVKAAAHTPSLQTVPSSSPSLAPSLGVPNTADEAQQSLEPEVLPTPKEKDASFKHVLPPSPARHHPAAADDEDAVQHGGKGGKQQGGQVPKTDAQQQPQTRAEKQASMLELADRAAQEAESMYVISYITCMHACMYAFSSLFKQMIARVLSAQMYIGCCARAVAP